MLFLSYAYRILSNFVFLALVYLALNFLEKYQHRVVVAILVLVYAGMHAASALRSFHFFQRVERLELEARRLVAGVVMTSAHCLSREFVGDPVGLGAYQMDSHHCRRLVHAGEDRVVAVPEAVPHAEPAHDVVGRATYGGDVVAVVNQRQVVVAGGGRRGDRDVRSGEHAEVAGERDGQFEPERAQRVVAAEVVRRQRVVPEDQHRVAHRLLIPSV